MKRDEAIDYLLDPIGKRGKHDEAIRMAIKALERKHGEWIKFDEGDCYCSNCGIALEDWVQGIFYKFCPYCGADMRGEDDEQIH